MKMTMDAPARICEVIDLPNCKIGRGRPKKSWNEVIKHDLKTLEIGDDTTHDRRL